MKATTLAIKITKREGGKKNIDNAQVTEILGHLADIIYEDSQALATVLDLGKVRSKKRFKKLILK